MNTNQPLATCGSAQAATDARDIALDLLQQVNARVRFQYCASSDEGDQTAELTKIGRQPRRDAGIAAAQPLPAAIGPLTAGVTYEFWLVGRNSQGEGPQSNHVTHVAT